MQELIEKILTEGHGKFVGEYSGREFILTTNFSGQGYMRAPKKWFAGYGGCSPDGSMHGGSDFNGYGDTAIEAVLALAKDMGIPV